MEKTYWKVKREEPYLSISLEKLGVDKDKIKKWSTYIINHSDHNYIYAHYDDEEDFGWCLHSKTSQDWYKEKNYKYKGEVKISDFEVDASKYNL